jgi:tRNA U34 5-methylaminomethyl-2-thiouridine-forming methyltransferase MnmC
MQLITTEDGSHSIFVKDLNEVYHSRFGAVNESRHVFIEAGLMPLSTSKTQNGLNILEIGFGTGLNAFLTLQQSLNMKLKVNYVTLEPYPIEKEIWQQLNYPEIIKMPLGNKMFRELHNCEWGRFVEINPRFRIEKHLSGIAEVELKDNYFDLIYFDAFAPEIAPELWTLSVFEKIFSAMKRGGLFVTYSAKGAVRRALGSAGFEVERIPGPKGKREMLRAVKG